MLYFIDKVSQQIVGCSDILNDVQLGYLQCYKLMEFYINIFDVAQRVKTSACNAGDPGSIPGLGRSPGVENGNPLQDSCLENPMD